MIGAVAGTKLSSKFGLQGKCKLKNPSKILNAARSGLSKVKSGASKIISKTKQVISKGKKYKSTIKKVMKRVATEGAKGGAKGAAEGYVQSKLSGDDSKQGVVSGAVSGAVGGIFGVIGSAANISQKGKLVQGTWNILTGAGSSYLGSRMSQGNFRSKDALIGGAQSIFESGFSQLTNGLEISNPIVNGMINWAGYIPSFTLGFAGSVVTTDD